MPLVKAAFIDPIHNAGVREMVPAKSQALMRRFLNLNVALASLAFVACVTINVYFPAASAEKAADQIIDTVTSGGSAAPTGTPPQGRIAPPVEQDADVAKTFMLRPVAWLGRAAGLALEAIVPAAQAQANANIDISTPEIRAITASMQRSTNVRATTAWVFASASTKRVFCMSISALPNMRRWRA